MRKRPSTSALKNGIIHGDRIMLSRAITLVESRRSDDKELANKLIEEILPYTGKSFRIGMTGVPGVGKSTFIEVFGKYLTSNGYKVAVLSIDPSSSISRGSILGDKTRMEELAFDPNAYIRPSPSGTHLGGVAQKTRESMLLCEAAGYDIIIIETVGVGQSETSVKNMVDFFLLLMLAGGGDELQGIKRGIMEMADMVVINKVDDPKDTTAARAAKEYERALHLFPPHPGEWIVPVLKASAVNNTGVQEVWKQVEYYRKLTQSNEYFQSNRKQQNVGWFREALNQQLIDNFYGKKGKKEEVKKAEEAISSGRLSIRKAIDQLF